MHEHSTQFEFPAKAAYGLDELTQLGLGCRATLYKTIARGELRATKLGWRTVVLAPDLEAWLASMPRAVMKPPRGAR